LWYNLDNSKRGLDAVQRKIRLENRLSGDKLLDALDLIETIRDVGGAVDELGFVTVYHRTSDSSTKAIYQTGIMTAYEDGLFFSTKKDGQNVGYGEAVVTLLIPVEELILDDIFSDEAHLRLPLTKTMTFNVSKFLVLSE
jgi:hypothetical protein